VGRSGAEQLVLLSGYNRGQPPVGEDTDALLERRR
jgi:hypothetical protein